MTCGFKRTKTPEDFKFLKEAFYNFKGHGNSYSHSIMDKMVMKGLDINAVDEVLEIYENSIWFMYFPHYKVNGEFFGKLVGEGEEMKKRGLKTLGKNTFLKFEGEGEREKVIEQLSTSNE